MYFLFHHLTPLIMPHTNWYKYRYQLRLIINRTTTTTNRMASRFPQSELPTNAFIEVEQLIRSTFDRIIGAAAERRDQLLVQLNGMKLDYLNKEEIRKKQVSELKKMIKQLKGMNIEQNPIVKVQEEQIKNLQKELKKYENPIPAPVPGYSTEDLESLLEQLRRCGTVEELGGPYTAKINPVKKFGTNGKEKGEFDCPQGLTLYKNESIYIADRCNSRIQIFSIAGKFVAEFGKEQLHWPYSIALNDKWVFVSDYSREAVYKFQITNNKYVCRSARGELYFPHGITVDTNGEVLVADHSNNRIAILNLELKLLRKIGKNKLKQPRDVKINKNNIFVADNNEINNIHIFTKSGDIIRSFIKLDKGTGPIYFCFDLNNNIIVSDYISNSIQIYTINGELIHKIVCKSYPKGIAVDNNNNIICVCYDNVVYIH